MLWFDRNIDKSCGEMDELIKRSSGYDSRHCLILESNQAPTVEGFPAHGRYQSSSPSAAYDATSSNRLLVANE